MADVEGAATQLARTTSGWESVDWWRLEARALKDLPELRRRLAFFAPLPARKYLAENLHTAGGWAQGCLLTLLNIASFTLPVVAAFLLIGWQIEGRATAPLALAGALAAIAGVIAGVGFVTDARRGQPGDPRIGWMLGSLHLIPSVIGLIIAVVALAQGEGGAPASALLGVAGLVLDVVVGALHFAIYRGPAHTDSDRAKRRLDEIREAIDAIDPSTRSAIYSDVQHALLTLHERDLISEEQWTRAHDLPIGLLALGMAPARPEGEKST